MTLENPLKRLLAPPVLAVDFRQSYWGISQRYAWVWVVLVVVSDLAVQWGSGLINLSSAATSFLAVLLLGSMPVRLAGALAGLYVTQALVSYFIVWLALSGRVASQWIEPATWAWQLWCVFALGVLVLRYIRTPKAEML